MVQLLELQMLKQVMNRPAVLGNVYDYWKTKVCISPLSVDILNCRHYSDFLSGHWISCTPVPSFYLPFTGYYTVKNFRFCVSSPDVHPGLLFNRGYGLLSHYSERAVAKAYSSPITGT